MKAQVEKVCENSTKLTKTIYHHPWADASYIAFIYPYTALEKPLLLQTIYF